MGNLDLLKRRWLSLLEGSLWENTYSAIQEAWKACFAHVVPKTQSCLEEGDIGRMVLVTVGPGRTEQELARALPGESYEAFLTIQRNAFYDLDRWEQREFAHWLFAVGNEVSASLMYMWSFYSYLTRIMNRFTGSESANASQPLIVPLEMVGGNSGAESLVRKVFQADAVASKRKRSI